MSDSLRPRGLQHARPPCGPVDCSTPGLPALVVVYTQLYYANTVVSWTTQVWTRQVHLHVDFFNAVLHSPWLVESVDGEPQIQRANCKVTLGFSTTQMVGHPKTCVVQESMVYYMKEETYLLERYSNRILKIKTTATTLVSFQEDIS